MKLKNKNVLVYGMSVSGEWVSKLLVKKKANVFLFDDDANKLKSKPVKSCYLMQNLGESHVSQFDLIIVSPAIEKDNKNLLFAKQNNIRVMSEVEFASQFCKKFVAITGTNGKTTTTELVTLILNKKERAVACGNIGYPLSRAVLENNKAIKVVETSSFMLENAEDFAPHVATVLNIQPDHLIRHKTMEEYATLKKSVFKNLKRNDYSVVNLDDNIHPTLDTLTVTYSYRHGADVYMKDGYIYLHQHKIVGLNELKLKGKHNAYNVMCAICFGFIYNVKPQKIREALLEFVPEKFRIEQTARINEVNFVNDSKSTNIASTLASVETVKGAIILLLGGSKKNLDYAELFSKLSKRVKFVICFGEIKEELFVANNEQFNMELCENLSEAFSLAVKNAKKNDTVLLSPATASYDQFSSYIERGKAFDNLVREYEIKSAQK